MKKAVVKYWDIGNYSITRRWVKALNEKARLYQSGSLNMIKKLKIN